MLFSSLEFLIFFPIVLCLHWCLPRAARRVLLLVASYLFYMTWNPPFVVLLLLSTGVDFQLARRLMVETREGARKLLVLASMCVNLGLLAYFKYARFLLDNLSVLGVDASWRFEDIILPLGISFYTFQTMSYTIDVYRRKIPAADSLLDFALYVSFFPQLIAGPIVRATEFLPQLAEPRERLRRIDVREGCELLLIGFFRKVYLADALGGFVDAQLRQPAELDFVGSWVVMYCFAFQIYFDFSGYSSIARGLARLLGFELPVNFDVPYLARNITDFWRRWHMTLSSWLRDYLYISLGGNRGSQLFTYRNLMLTMLIGGLWHGAAWNFVIWGGLHSAYLAAHKLWLGRASKAKAAPDAPRWQGALGVAITFHLVCITWVFFRLPTFDEAWRVLEAMMGLHGVVLAVAPELLHNTVFQSLAVYGLARAFMARSRGSLSLGAVVFYASLLVYAVLYIPPAGRKFIYFDF
jgi:alginate O-acetyltransferase complex protein AlgI